MKKKFAIVLMVLTISAAVFLAACGDAQQNDQKEIRVGYFPSVSHAPAMVGLEKGFFQEQLRDYNIKTQTFPNGSLLMDSLSTGQLDIGYVGPGPVINRYLQGGEIVIIANASKGENVLIVRKGSGIHSIQDLKGKIVATPSTGCTHDLILRKMLQDNGLAVEENGGSVKRITAKPATMIGLIQQKQIDAALVSEPWASLIQEKTGAEIIVEWNEVPWKGELPAAVLVARKDFLEKNPKAVESFLKGHNKAIQFIRNNPEETVQAVGKQIKEITGEEIESKIIRNSLHRVQATQSLDRNTMQEFADLSKELGFIKGNTSLEGLFGESVKSINQRGEL